MLRLPALFSNNAVFQQGIAVPIWGWSEPGCDIECRFNGQTLKTQASADGGRFMVRLQPMEYGGPFKMEVRNLRSGEMLCIDNIMIGEVWLASGQSNMEMPMLAVDDRQAIADADFPLLRMITVPRAARITGCEDFTGCWEVSSPQTAWRFSAVAYYFARKLQSELGLAIGVIHSSWGGTVAEAWCSREGLMKNPDYIAAVKKYESRYFPSGQPDTGMPEIHGGPDAVMQPLFMETFGSQVVPNDGYSQGWAAANFDDENWESVLLPFGWVAAGENYNGMHWKWYRRAVEIPVGAAEADWLLTLGITDRQDTTYFNGIRLECMDEERNSKSNDVMRRYKVPASLLHEGRNVIAVRVCSFMGEGGILGPAAAMKMVATENPAVEIKLAGKWKFKIEKSLETPAESAGMFCGRNTPKAPHRLFDNMIKPLLPYALRGVIWYQGESNAAEWRTYCNLMITLIDDWRRSWGQGSFPFYQVQLANYRQPQKYQHDSEWARIRDAQVRAGRAAGCNVAVAIDCGDAANIHPLAKNTVGERLAAIALNQTYGKREIVPCGPLYRGMTIDGENVRLKFDYCSGGLRGDCGGFFIADSSGEFMEAAAEIDGDDTVVVWNSAVKNPVAVRYAWADNPSSAQLCNGAGLPASPFRSDDW